MIIVKLMGGLGNQMFQYAAGKSLADRLGVQLKLDTSFLELREANPGYTLRDFELDVFTIDAAIATKSEVSQMRNKRLSKLLPFLFSNHVFFESQKKYMKEFEPLTDPAYLEGYWQTEKYFLSIAKKLKEKDFMPAATISGMNAQLLDEIKKCNSVSLHVRRGDYVSNPETNKFHGTCSVDYYERSMKMICEKTDVDHFYIFSDEPDWVKSTIKIPFPATYISHNKDRESYWDLFLMRHCKHNIIANSSFSWWSAWLNANPGKMVFAPEKWFNDSPTSDNEIVPGDWLKITVSK